MILETSMKVETAETSLVVEQVNEGVKYMC